MTFFLETPAALADHVTEQVMRCCSDLDLAQSLTTAPPGSPQAAAALGRLLAAVPNLPLVVGSPVCVWVSGGTLDPHWRAAYPPTPDSAYAHLAFLAELYPDEPEPGRGTDPFARLVDLNERAAHELLA